MHSPSLSVLLTVYNGERFLREAVESLLAQTADDFEIVAVDDGSTDGTADVLASYDDERLVVVESEVNRGRAPALNRGLFHCRGEYVAVLDADDIADPTRLDRQRNFLDDNPSVDVVGSWFTRQFHGTGRTETVRAPTAHRDVVDALTSHNPIAHSSTMYRRAAVEAIGGYDVSRTSCIDYDLWVRLADGGFRFATVPEPLVTIRKHDARAFDFDGWRRFRRALTESEVQLRAVEATGKPAWEYGVVLARRAKSLLEDVVDELQG